MTGVETAGCGDSGRPMWPLKPRPDAELLRLFELSGQNVQRAAALMRDLLVSYPERPELARARNDSEHHRAPGVHDNNQPRAERGACGGRSPRDVLVV